MTLIFQRIETDGIAQLSYLVGDDGARTAAVVDPRPDVEVYLELARRFGVAITHVFETHIHADFMSGARELVDRLGGGELCVSGEGEAQYGFTCRRIVAGDSFDFGPLVLTARHTPGHTPEHLAFELTERGERAPWGVLTGDSLFVGSAGRPDLLGQGETEELTRALFHTLRDYYLKLDEGVLLYPCHGAGSACGADIGDRPMGTIGYERRTNPFLQRERFEDFQRLVEESAPPIPHHYPRLKKLNASGPPVLGAGPSVRALTPVAFHGAIPGAQLLDTRQMLAYGGGHIHGAINIGARPELSVWAGQMLDVDKPLLLVVDHERDLPRVVGLLVDTGFVEFRGYLAGGMQAWSDAAFPVTRTREITVHELRQHMDQLQVLDVRTPQEWEGGHVPRAQHVYVADMRAGLAGAEAFDRELPVAVFCASGYRASIATSILERHGFEDARTVVGSWNAWTAAGYEVER
jgi:hydroxyacylglutathione hydrolase